MGYRFFLSYASADNAAREARDIEAFHKALCAEIDGRVVPEPGVTAGYLERHEVEMGVDWKEDIATAIRTCQVFVPMMSLRYFSRPYCGKEWHVFENRCAAVPGKRPPLILPLLWMPPVEKELPEFATDLQYTFPLDDVRDEDRQFLEDYARHGLAYVMKRRESTHGNAYQTILEKLAARIIEVAARHPLPDLPVAALPRLDQAQDRFEELRDADAAAPDDDVPLGEPNLDDPGWAHFFYLVGDHKEMAGRRAADVYRKHAVMWRPFHPPESVGVGMIAQRAVGDRFFYNWIPVDERLPDHLSRIEGANAIAILVIDPWSVGVEKYAKVLARVDERVFRNLAVFVAWNGSDAETAQRRAVLRETLDRLLDRRRTVLKDPGVHVDDSTALWKAIRFALDHLDAVLAAYRKPQRPTPPRSPLPGVSVA